MKDDEIIALYWNRDEAAIDATAEKYRSYCYRIAFNILHNHEDAEECVNDAYLSAWNAIPPHRPTDLTAFLGKLTRNRALNQYARYTAAKRGLGQTELVLSELEDCIPARENVEQAVAEKDLTASLNRFLLAQPPQNRNIFIRRYWYLDPVREIARAYGMSQSKVTSLLFRMRGKIKEHLYKEDMLL